MFHQFVTCHHAFLQGTFLFVFFFVLFFVIFLLFLVFVSVDCLFFFTAKEGYLLSRLASFQNKAADPLIGHRQESGLFKMIFGCFSFFLFIWSEIKIIRPKKDPCARLTRQEKSFVDCGKLNWFLFQLLETFHCQWSKKETQDLFQDNNRNELETDRRFWSKIISGPKKMLF